MSQEVKEHKAENTAVPAPQEALHEHPTSFELQEFFKRDVFAYEQTVCRIIEGYAGHAVAEMTIDPCKHLNAQGYVMGGVIFTLADYALAAASVCGRGASVSLTSTIEFIKGAKAGTLKAICDADHSGRRVGFYTIRVVDESDALIAKVTATCYHPI